MRYRFAGKFALALWTLTMLCSVLSLPLAEQGGLIVLVPLATWTVTSSTVGTIIAELLSTVRQTMQPEHISLWLRPEEGTGGRPTN